MTVWERYKAAREQRDLLVTLLNEQDSRVRWQENYIATVAYTKYLKLCNASRGAQHELDTALEALLTHLEKA